VFTGTLPYLHKAGNTKWRGKIIRIKIIGDSRLVELGSVSFDEYFPTFQKIVPSWNWETSGIASAATQRHIRERSILQKYRCENLKSVNQLIAFYCKLLVMQQFMVKHLAAPVLLSWSCCPHLEASFVHTSTTPRGAATRTALLVDGWLELPCLPVRFRVVVFVCLISCLLYLNEWVFLMLHILLILRIYLCCEPAARRQQPTALSSQISSNPLWIRPHRRLRKPYWGGIRIVYLLASSLYVLTSPTYPED
jgi:hypothetical protein